MIYQQLNFKLILVSFGWNISCKIALRWLSLDLAEDKFNSGSGSGMVPSDTNPLPEPVLTKISHVVRCY